MTCNRGHKRGITQLLLTIYNFAYCVGVDLQTALIMAPSLHPYLKYNYLLRMVLRSYRVPCLPRRVTQLADYLIEIKDGSTLHWTKVHQNMYYTDAGKHLGILF